MQSRAWTDVRTKAGRAVPGLVLPYLRQEAAGAWPQPEREAEAPERRAEFRRGRGVSRASRCKLPSFGHPEA